jgi:hypothetical protein
MVRGVSLLERGEDTVFLWRMGEAYRGSFLDRGNTKVNFWIGGIQRLILDRGDTEVYVIRGE